MEPVQHIQRPVNSSNVTLVSGDTHVCKHYKFGFCKFGEKCHKQHLKETCQTEDCYLKTCPKRHPKICKFLSVSQVCKFGDACCYKHKLSASHCKILEQISSLQATISSMSESILALENEILRLRSSPPDTLRTLDPRGDLAPSPEKSCLYQFYTLHHQLEECKQPNNYHKKIPIPYHHSDLLDNTYLWRAFYLYDRF